MRSAGRKRDFLFIVQITEGQDSIGGETEADTVDKGRECEIRPLFGREQFSSDRENNAATVEVRFWYEENLVNNKCRLEDRSVSPATVYDVESVVDPNNKHRELICTCVVRD